jgi:hypothetical protein
VKSTIDCTKNFAALLKKLGPAPARQLPDAGDPVAVLVMSFLLWDSTTDKALAAYERIRAGCVDFNELRVCLPHESIELLGQRYPKVIERAQRLRATMNDIFNREHAMHLNRLKELGKREVKTYLDSLEGMVPYVSARMLLLCFNSHAIPVDDQLREALIAAEAADEKSTVADLVTWLARHVKAEEGEAAHFALQAWVERGGRVPGGARGGASKKAKPAVKRAAGKTASRAS